jgi:hypothetical protein
MIAGGIDTENRIRQCAGGVRAAAQYDAHIGHFSQRRDFLRPIPQDTVQKLNGFKLPHQKGGLQGDLNVELGALLKPLLGGQAGMDDAVPVILPMEILQGGLYGHDGLVKGRIADRMHLDLKPLVTDLSRCAWESLKVFLQQAVPENNPIPGASIAIQTFGDFLGFNPHCHILVTDGCFYGDNGMFRVAPPLELKKLETIFRHRVFKMLLEKGKVSREMIAMLSTWLHSGFHVFCGNRIGSQHETAMENLARYIIRASFSQEQMVRYYGHYSNVSRGKRKQAGTDDVVPYILEPQGNSKAFRKSWARLIQKIYEVDPLVCPKCQGTMRIISFIEDPSVIRAILSYLGLWLARARPPPKIHDPPVCVHSTGGPIDPVVMDDLPINNDDHLYRDPEYTWDDYIQA